MKSWHLFDRYGIELEYMIVDRVSREIRPLAPQLLQALAGSETPVCDAPCGFLSWSNELVAHVVELKSANPFGSFQALHDLLHQEILRAAKILEQWDACLLPGGVHPWMNPIEETTLWPHGNQEIYAQYHKIFDCRRHGWANLQSTHLNISFKGDEEFGRLHAAVRAVLPLISALGASSPYLDGKFTGFFDGRLQVYRHNQAAIPELTGLVIPENVFDEDSYEKRIFSPIRSAMAAFDPERILNFYFLNSRGAIARFDRSSLEIRVLDNQECVYADCSIISAIVAFLKWAAEPKRSMQMRDLDTQKLAQLYELVICGGLEVPVEFPEFTRALEITGRERTVKEIWLTLSGRISDFLEPDYRSGLEYIITKGNLATRMVSKCGKNPSKLDLKNMCGDLTICLQENRFYC